MFRLMAFLFRINLLAPTAIARLLSVLWHSGINIIALLRFTARTRPEQVALVDDQETLSYKQLLAETEQLAKVLNAKYPLLRGRQVGFLCKNHGSLVKGIFAASCLGAEVCLLNAEISCDQLKSLLRRHAFALIIYDAETGALLRQAGYSGPKLLSYHRRQPAINNLLFLPGQKTALPPRAKSKLVILTGGTTGTAKAAVHTSSLNYFAPLLALLDRLKLAQFNRAYIATPLFHGAGVSFLLLFIALGYKIVLTRKFDPAKACDLVRKHAVEVLTGVPLIVRRMLEHCAGDLKSLARILSGSAELKPGLVGQTVARLGPVICNLYGTSETGLITIACPRDLASNPATIGKKLPGLKVKILSENDREKPRGQVGHICVKSKWGTDNRGRRWLDTGVFLLVRAGR